MQISVTNTELLYIEHSAQRNQTKTLNRVQVKL